MARVGLLNAPRINTPEKILNIYPRKSEGRTPEGLKYKRLDNYHEVYTEIELLGQGGFGSVWKCYDNYERRMVAVKKIKFDKETHINYIHAELTALRTLARGPDRSKSIPEYYTSFVITEGDQDYFCIVMQYVEGRTLDYEVYEFNSVPVLIGNHYEYSRTPERFAILFSIWLFDTLAYIHEHGWAHRDIKPPNIIMNVKDGKFMLLDFGIACLMRHGDIDTCDFRDASGTKQLIPPERYDRENQYKWIPNFDPNSDSSLQMFAKGDIWTAGITIYFVLMNKYPWSSNKSEVVRAESRNPMYDIRLNYPYVPGTASEELVRIVYECLRQDPMERPSARSIADRLMRSYKADEKKQKKGRVVRH